MGEWAGAGEFGGFVNALEGFKFEQNCTASAWFSMLPFSENMPSVVAICEEKVRLMEKYADAAHLFSRAVERLLRDRHNPTTFDLGRQNVSRAKERCNRACLALDKHCGTHNC